MKNSDPSTPVGINFVFTAEAEPTGDDPDPCVWCNHPQNVAERKFSMADHKGVGPDDIPDSEAKCLADYEFVVGNHDGEHVTIPVCEGCLYDLPVEYGESAARDLPFAWQEEVVLKTEVPRPDAASGYVHRGVPVAALADIGTDFSAE